MSDRPHTDDHDAAFMPDDCHDHCVKAGTVSMYYPYRWDDGTAWYECDNGHRWTCGWSFIQGNSGQAPRYRGHPIARYEVARRGDG